MQQLAQAYQYVLDNQTDFWRNVVVHLQLSFSALLIALVICVPLGIDRIAGVSGNIVRLNVRKDQMAEEE